MNKTVREALTSLAETLETLAERCDERVSLLNNEKKWDEAIYMNGMAEGVDQAIDVILDLLGRKREESV